MGVTSFPPAAPPASLRLPMHDSPPRPAPLPAWLPSHVAEAAEARACPPATPGRRRVRGIWASRPLAWPRARTAAGWAKASAERNVGARRPRKRERRERRERRQAVARAAARDTRASLARRPAHRPRRRQAGVTADAHGTRASSATHHLRPRPAVVQSVGGLKEVRAAGDIAHARAHAAVHAHALDAHVCRREARTRRAGSSTAARTPSDDVRSQRSSSAKASVASGATRRSCRRGEDSGTGTPEILAATATATGTSTSCVLWGSAVCVSGGVQGGAARQLWVWELPSVPRLAA